MQLQSDRNRNLMDGTYANVPNWHEARPSQKIGLREFNNSVLIHNWYEDRNPFDKKVYGFNSSYNMDYKPYKGAKPDILLRRRMTARNDGVGSKNLIGMQDYDSSKGLISLYDEDINRRARPATQKLPEQRIWKIIDNKWLPEKIDQAMQAEPTRWGLVDKKRDELYNEADKYRSRLRDITEYEQKYQAHERSAYMERSKFGVPKPISTNLQDQTMASGEAAESKQGRTNDVMDATYKNSLHADPLKRAQRTMFYLNKIPTDGSLDIYSMRDFETLTPKITN